MPCVGRGILYYLKQPGKPRDMSIPESNPSLPMVPCGRIQHHLSAPAPHPGMQFSLILGLKQWALGSLMYLEPGSVESHRLKVLHGPFVKSPTWTAAVSQQTPYILGFDRKATV